MIRRRVELLRKAISGIILSLLLISILTMAFNVQPSVNAEPVEIIIDTEVWGTEFTAYPPGGYWVHVQDHDTFYTRAYSGNFWYTLCGEEGHGDPLYYGLWQASLPHSGMYEVFVWIPNPDAFEYDGRVYTPTQSAIYQIYYKDGMTTRTVNQRLRTGGWYSVGTYTFDTTASIRLNDRTGEPYCSTMIAFDAIKFVRKNQPPTCSLYADPTSGEIPLDVTFYMSASDPDGSISAWVLDVDGDGNADYEGYGNPPSTQPHKYTTAGSYSVILGVIDDEDETAFAFETVNVYAPSEYTLTIYSSPSGVTFTADGVSHTTPWSETYTKDTSVSLVMPSTHTVGEARYPWEQWSEDGDTNRIKTITLSSTTTLTAVYGPPPEVHDVAVTNVVPSPTSVTVGDSVSIDVAVENQGNFAETFDVTVYYDDTVIDSMTGVSLGSGGSDVLSFTWDTTGVAPGTLCYKC